MDIVRQGTVGKQFVCHTGYDLTAWDNLKFDFYGPDGDLRFEVTDGVNPEDVDDSGTPTDGDMQWTDVAGAFPVDTPADLGIWSIVPIIVRDGKTLPGAPSMQFKVIAKDAVQ
jgi:hypothetical protein